MRGNMEIRIPEWAKKCLYDDAFTMEGQTFETLKPDENNSDAIIAAQSLLQHKADRIIIWGKTGCGKTHLLKAIYNQAKQEEAKVLYIRAADFVEGLIQAIRFTGRAQDWSDLFLGLDYLLIDDIRCMEGKQSTQIEFLNCLDRIGDTCRIAMTSDRPVNEYWDMNDSICRRLREYRTVHIYSVNPAVLLERNLNLMRQLCTDLQVELSEDALMILAMELGEDIASAQRMIEALDDYRKQKCATEPMQLEGQQSLELR